MQYCLQNELNKEVIMLWHKDNNLSMFSTNDCIVLPGGFSYGDYLRCGAIARFSPMMQAVIAFAQKGGKVLGVCNGFQILCEAHLLPGALLQNIHQKFVCKNIFIQHASSAALKIPIAHGDGRYFAHEAVLEELEKNKQILFRYCLPPLAEETLESNYNPNGSLHDIAGICNKQGNVMGMMPHPERAASEKLGNADGVKVFQLLGLL
jgi:phosphoribosylformylglycinamidine synthase